MMNKKWYNEQQVLTSYREKRYVSHHAGIVIVIDGVV